MNTLREQSMSRVSVLISRGREVLRNTGIPKTSVFCFLHNVLQLYSYKLLFLQQLLPDDAAKRMLYKNWALLDIKEDPQWLFNILCTDEVHFSLRRTHNTHSCRIWAKENPHAYTEKSLYTPHVTFGLVLPRKFLWVPFSLKSLVQI